MNGLLHKFLAQFCVSPIGVAMPGPRLPKRLRNIVVEECASTQVSRASAALLIVACVAICASFVVVTLTRAQSSQANWEKAAGGKQSFDAASIKQNTAGLPLAGPPARANVPLSDDDGFKPTGGLFRAGNLPLTVFISFAYKLNFSQELVLATQATHSSSFKWAIGKRWDIDARAPGNPTKNQYRMMVQSLLADRFKLAVHWGTIQGPVYNVELQSPDRLGPQLIPHLGDVPCSNMPKETDSTKEQPAAPCGATMFNSPKPGRSRLSGRAVNMQQIVDRLGVNAPELRPTYDHTGLTGTFDFSMEWATEYRGPTPPGYPEPDVTAPPFLDALKNQLGLKLEPVTGPIDVLIIDHVEEPTAN